VLAQSSRALTRAYATNVNLDNPMLRQSERDFKPNRRIPGHPDDPSSVLDTIDQPPTAETRSVEERLKSQQSSMQALQADINAHVTARIMAFNDVPSTTTSTPPPGVDASTPSTPDAPEQKDPLPFSNLKQLNRHRRHAQKEARRGTNLSQTYDPNTILAKPPRPTELTLPMLLANQTHLGHATSLWNPANSGYIFGTRDGIHVISLDVTYAYLVRAAKVVQEVARRGGIVLFIGTRKGQEDIVINTAKLAGGYHIFHRWVPGSLTNGQQILGACGVKVVDMHDREVEQYRHAFSQGNHTVMRPDLVVCLNPLENQVCLHECGLFNVPTVGIIDTDANPSWVTYPIPANDDSFRSVALIGGVLGQAGAEGQRLRKRGAMRGEATYDTAHVQKILEGVQEIASLEVKEVDRGT
jgi:small subunit ribosomal protein S2